MTDPLELHFGPFRLRSRQGPLLHGDVEIKLQPKTTLLLWTLASAGGKPVPKSALMDAVWPGTDPSDEALSFQVQTLRRALGDDPKQPQHVITVHRVGFRFGVQVHHGDDTPQVADTCDPFVGRGDELQTLQAHFDAAERRQQRQAVFVTGEAGIGKSRLLDAFLAQLRKRAPQARMLAGHCADRSNANEPYQPILQALHDALRDQPQDALLELLRRIAPSWLLQMPSLLAPTELALLKQQNKGVSQERMLREMAEVLDLLAADGCLVLAIEDLHWSDSATLDLLTTLILRTEKARLLIVCTMRETNVDLAEQAIRPFLLRLRARNKLQQMALPPLDPQAVSGYLQHRLGERPLSPDLLNAVYERSGGHPLFMVHIADYLDAEDAPLPSMIQMLEKEVPQQLQDVIELQLGRLSLSEQLILEACSMAGEEFAAAAAAAAAGINADAADHYLEGLALRRQFVESRGLAIWPDGTTSGRFRFRHALYAKALRCRISVSRQARLHRSIAECLEAAYGSRSHEISSELALHHEQGGQRARALPYRILTARIASQRVAPEEVRVEVERGLDLLDTVPEGLPRKEAELRLRVIAANALLREHGYASTPAREHTERLPALLEGIEDPTLLAEALAALWVTHHYRGKFDVALGYAERVRALGAERGIVTLECSGLAWSAHNLHLTGRSVEALDMTTQALRLVQAPDRGDGPEYPPLEPTCSALIGQAIFSWYVGAPDTALRFAQKAVAATDLLGSPLTRCTALWSAMGMVLLMRRDWQALLDHSEQSIPYCRRYGDRDAASLSLRQRCMALAMLGRTEEGLPTLMEELQSSYERGCLISLPLDYTTAAECYLKMGRLAQARTALDRAWHVIRNHDLLPWEPETLRIESRWIQATNPERLSAAENCLRQAIQIAQQRRVRGLHLRAAIDFARLWIDQGAPEKGLPELQAVYDTFTEGRDTVDLRAARVLLDS